MKGELCFPGQGIPSCTISIRRRTLAAVLAMALVGVFLPSAARAVPYASGVSNNAGTVSFILNEAADNVTVLFDGGATSSDLGALDKGTHSFNLGAATTFAIVVSKNVARSWTQISTDSQFTRFFSARGVAVNLNASTPLFGRVYVANAVSGTTATGARTTGDGIFLLNADLSDALGRGDTASTAGLSLSPAPAAQNGNTPWRIEVGEDNRLYIADFSTNQGSIYRTDADVSGGSGEQVLAGQGSIGPNINLTVHTTICGSPIAKGTAEAGTLAIWCIDGAMGGNLNRLMRWNVANSPLPFNVAPVPVAVPNPLISTVANVTTDNDTAPDGKFFVMQNRSAGTEVGLAVLDPAGVTLWNSLAVSRSISNNPSAVDILRVSRAVKVSPDNRNVALIRDDNQTWIIPLTNGIPDLARRELVATFAATPTVGRDVSWDAAGNLYVVSSGVELLRVFSPGGTTTATTRSDGTFTLFEVLPPDVSLAVSDNLGSENGPDTVAFTITRSGSTAGSLTVNYTLGGTAVNGSDYATNELAVTFMPGEASVNVVLTPTDDTEAEQAESVTLALAPTTNYVVVTTGPATAHITDNETPQFTLTSARPVVYEDSFYYNPEFVLTRLGETNVEVLVEVISTNSTASEGVDVSFILPTIDVPPGVIQRPFSVTLIRDDEIEGDETLGITIVPGFDSYTIGSPHTASVTIRDNDSAGCVVFRDDFEVNSSDNWITRFGANNGIQDATVFFAEDYFLSRGIPPAPHSAGATTFGLFVQVNKTQATALGSAGINFYPLMQSFSGDYALRFDLYLSFGGASTTEHALAGLNHSGNLTNRVTQSADAGNSTAGGDGVYVAIESDGSANREWTAYTYTNSTSLPIAITNRTATAVSNLVTAPPYAFPGSPGNNAVPAAGSTNFFQWADVELRQENNIISLRVNNDLIYSFPNTSGFNSGNIMIGMNDQFDSVGAAGNFAVFDNVRVIDLKPIRITSIRLTGNQVEIDFTDRCPNSPNAYRLQRASSVTENFVDDPSAMITDNPDGGFRATAFQLGPVRYYRIRH